MPETISTQALADWIHESARLVRTNKEALNDLDSFSGDGDHGSNLHRGFSAVAETLEPENSESPRDLLKTVGTTLVSKVGGSSGALYGTFFLRMALACGTEAVLDGQAFGKAFAAAAQGIVDRGQVEVGDKTLYDALAPAVESYEREVSAGHGLGAALDAAAEAAGAGRDATAQMMARKGRASYLGERTLGYADAGSTSMALIIGAAAKTLG